MAFGVDEIRRLDCRFRGTRHPQSTAHWWRTDPSQRLHQGLVQVVVADTGYREGCDDNQWLQVARARAKLFDAGVSAINVSINGLTESFI